LPLQVEEFFGVDQRYLSFPAVIGHQQRRGIIELLEVTYETGSEGRVHARVQA
jgi:hypothetical protein